MMIEENSHSQVQLKNEQQNQQQITENQVNEVDPQHDKEAENQDEQKANNEMSAEKIEQLHKEQQAQSKNSEQIQQPTNMRTQNIYRKKSQLLGNLKLKTYDVHEDEDEPIQTNLANNINERVITIEMAQQEEKQQVDMQKEQNVEYHEDNVGENNQTLEQQKVRQHGKNVQILGELSEVKVEQNEHKPMEVYVEEGITKDNQLQRQDNLQNLLQKVDQFQGALERTLETQIFQVHPNLYSQTNIDVIPQAQQQMQDNTQQHQPQKEQEEKQTDKQPDLNQQEQQNSDDEKNLVQQKISQTENQQQLSLKQQHLSLKIDLQAKKMTNQLNQTNKQLNLLEKIQDKQNNQQPTLNLPLLNQQSQEGNRQESNYIQKDYQIQNPTTDQINNPITQNQSQNIVKDQQKRQILQSNDDNKSKDQNVQNKQKQQEQSSNQSQHQKDPKIHLTEINQQNFHSQEQKQQENENQQQNQNEVEKSIQQTEKIQQLPSNQNDTLNQSDNTEQKELQNPNQSLPNHQQSLYLKQVHIQQQFKQYEAIDTKQVDAQKQFKNQEAAKNDGLLTLNEVIIDHQQQTIKQSIEQSISQPIQQKQDLNNHQPPSQQTQKIQPLNNQLHLPKQNRQTVKAPSFKSRKIQRLSQLNQPKQVVRNRSLHSLVTTIHKTQQNPIKVPLHRPSNSQKKIRGQSPNLNRLKYNIGLDSKIIDLTVGEIFEQKGRKNDEMKSMLLKEIETLKEQIDLYERQEKDSKRQSFTQPVQSRTHEFNPNTPLRKSKHEKLISSSTHRQKISELSSLHNKMPKYYTSRGPKFPIISPGQVPQFYNKPDRIQHTSSFNESPSRLDDLMISSPQRRGNVCGRIVRKYNHDTLRNSQVNHTNGELSRTLVNESEGSFVEQFSSNQVIESPLKISQGGKFNERGSKKKIGSIISLREVSSRKKQQKQSQVNAPVISQLQQIALPQKYKKQLQWQSLKQLPCPQLYSSLNNQLNSIITKTKSLSFPTADSSQQQLVHFAHSVFFSFGINIQSEEFLLNIKRYKNCIVFGLTCQETIICHFDQNRKIYYGGWNGKEKHGWGFEVTDQHVYKGEWKANRKSGVGVMRVKKSEHQEENIADEKNQHKFVYYMGNWQNNSRQNFGIQLESTSNHVIEYQGNWLSNKKTGQTTVNIYSRKSANLIQSYTGQFLNGQKHGSGIENFANGDKYEGQYSHNKFNGKGKYFWKNGSCFMGDFVQGLRDGKGQWFSDATDLEVMQNISQNNGNMAQLKGDYYRGEYKNDKKNGFGIYRWKNGTIYEGQFENDQKVGEGTLIVESNATFNSQTKVKTINNNS